MCAESLHLACSRRGRHCVRPKTRQAKFAKSGGGCHVFAPKSPSLAFGSENGFRRLGLARAGPSRMEAMAAAGARAFEAAIALPMEHHVLAARLERLRELTAQHRALLREHDARVRCKRQKRVQALL